MSVGGKEDHEGVGAEERKGWLKEN